jgi:hypothetical protein
MRGVGRELAVPALMLAGIGLFLYDSVGLSTQAMLFPCALIVVIVGSLCWAAAAALWSRRRPAGERAAGESADAAIGPVTHAKPWLLVLVPAALTAAFDAIGALAALLAMVVLAQLVLDRRAPARGLLLAFAVTVPTYALFKLFLYVRFPAGPLGLG